MKAALKAIGHTCTGCGACASRCPVSAISMIRDDEGFLEARIDQNVCVHCDLCRRTCPVLNPDYGNLPPVCHAMAAPDDERMLSTSGGIFPLLAQQVIEEGGIVFGAVWNDDFSASIVSAENLDELVPLRGSKYVQSNTEDTFRAAREALSAGRRVLYSGCPCQIAGLKASLGDMAGNDRLLTAEVVCHGTTSPAVLQKHLRDSYAGKDVSHVSFRDKASFGWHAGELVTMADGSQESYQPSPYMEAFNPCLIMGRECGICPFSRLPRQADITLGDFWGIDQFRPDLNDGKGLSIVLGNNERGQRAVEGLRDTVIVDEVLPLDHATHINKTIIHPFPNHPGRKHFFSAIDLKPFNELRDASLTSHYDVGIVGLWYGVNYGSILTYYALYVTLRACGFDAVMLPRPQGLWSDSFDDPGTMAQRFMWDHCNVFLPYPSREEYIAANDCCDQFVLGSDVVWLYRVCGRETDQFFFLDWAKSDHKKIAYASSLGSGLAGPDSYVSKALYHLDRFDAISVRETMGAAQLTEMTGRDDIANTLDPVFLCGRETYDAIIDEEPREASDEPFVFSYLLRPVLRQLKARFLAQAKESLGATLRIAGNASDLEYARSLVADVAQPGDEYVEAMSVSHWLRSVRDCALYVGDSYHGMCLSLIYHVPFVTVYSPEDYSFERVVSLLGLVGLQDRLITEHSTDEEIETVLVTPIDWKRVDAVLDTERTRSLTWLRAALAQEGKEPTVEDFLHDESLERRAQAARELRETRESLQGLRDEVAGLRGTISDLQGTVSVVTERLQEQQGVSEELVAVKSSRSYRMGRMLTWLPRHLRDGLRHSEG